jgi:indole-3-glycerol phosphate synthase
MTTNVPDLLAAIVAATRARVEAARARESREAVEGRASACQPRGAAFIQALDRTSRVNIIAECKRRSPSRGVLRAAYDPVALAQGYEAGGAVALSVLTEPMFFDGSLAHLEAVRNAVRLPVLCKDFIVEAYQVAEAAAAGADAILLIVAALDNVTLTALMAEAWDRGMAALVEVHTEDELDRALAADARIVGVNNRSLKTLAVDVDVSEHLAARIPPSVIAVCESGLRTSSDLARFSALGYRAFLIGERFMATPDPGGALAGLLTEASG